MKECPRFYIRVKILISKSHFWHLGLRCTGRASLQAMSSPHMDYLSVLWTVHVKRCFTCSNLEQSPVSKTDDGLSTAAGYFSLVIFCKNFQALTSVKSLSSVLPEEFQNAHFSSRTKGSLTLAECNVMMLHL